MADKNNEKSIQNGEQSDSSDEARQFRKTGLGGGKLDVISIHRPSVIIDSHMHIQSGNCATLQFIRDSGFFPINKLTRGPIEGLGLGASYFLDFFCEWMLTPILHPVRAVTQAITDDPKNPDQSMVHTSPIRQLLKQQKGSTLEIGDAFMVERDNVLANFFLTLPEYKGLSHLALAAVVMTMDMEYAHLDGYYGLRIHNAVYADENFSQHIGYWYPCHGTWGKRGSDYQRVPGRAHILPPDRYTKVEFDKIKNSAKTLGISGAYPKPGGQFEAMRVEAAPVMMPNSETIRYEQWKEQLDYTEQAMLAYPLKMLPMYHFDPRRWQFRSVKEGQNRLDVFDNVKTGGLYLGFKMYTPQGYRPWDINRLPILGDFYAECSRLGIPILNHCTPKGAATVERDLYYDFTHPNDTAEDRQEKNTISEQVKKKEKTEEIQYILQHGGRLAPEHKSKIKETYFTETFVSPNAWRKVLDSEVEGRKLSDLYLCLAHFGGPTEQGQEWSEQCIEMMLKYPNFYVDISSSFASGTFRKHFKKLMQNKSHFEIIRNRVLFGTDWYMTLLYTAPFHGMNYWDYCTETKTFLDKIDPGLWPRFTMHNPYRFYRLDKQVPRIAESIIARRQTPEMEDVSEKEIVGITIEEIRKDAAWIRQANDGFGI